MAEFVGYKDPIGNGDYNMGLTDEEIIRCRDCKFATEDKFSRVLWCLQNHNHDGEMNAVNPYGYCAWAERDA